MQLRPPKSKERLRREAAAWLARLQSGRDPDAEPEFQRWYEASPAHANAFDRVQRSYDVAALLRHSPAGRESMPVVRAQASWPGARYALGAAAVLVVLVTAGLVATDGALLWPDRTNVLMVATAVGEIRQIRLNDGSNVILDTASSVEVELDRSNRRALLKRGRARFRVVEAARPFVITAGDVMVATPGAVLDVERTGPETRVEVLSGTADVGKLDGRQAGKLPLGAGKGMTVKSGQPLEARAAAGGTEWIRGMLQFDGTPLRLAVAAANRYSTRQIVIGPGLEQLRVTGAFRAGDTTGLAKALAAAFNLSVRATPDGKLSLSHNNLRNR